MSWRQPPQTVQWHRHHDDRGIDEIHFVGAGPLPKTYEEVTARAFLRLSVVERYKTSDLSGDEWRFSTQMHLREYVDRDKWELVSSGYRDLETHAKAIYPELFGDHLAGKNPWLNGRMVAAIAFSWRGLPVYSTSHAGDPMPTLVTCGHLPWALIQAAEEGQFHRNKLSALCCQPGCRRPHTTVYGLRHRYSRDGIARPAGGLRRGFCAQHARRGDCGLEDADANYIVVSGHGPDRHEPDPGVVKQALRVNLPNGGEA